MERRRLHRKGGTCKSAARPLFKSGLHHHDQNFDSIQERMEPSLFPGPGLRIPASRQISQEHRDDVKVKDVVCVSMWAGVARAYQGDDVGKSLVSSHSELDRAFFRIFEHWNFTSLWKFWKRADFETSRK